MTPGEKGAVYVDEHGNYGHIPAQKTQVIDTTGAGDGSFTGVVGWLDIWKEFEGIL